MVCACGRERERGREGEGGGEASGGFKGYGSRGMVRLRQHMRVVGGEREAVHRCLACLEHVELLAALAAPALDEPIVAARSLSS